MNNKKFPIVGDIIQTGIIFATGDGEIVWVSHQVVRRISDDGLIWYRPKNANVDKTPYRWRFPVVSTDEIIEDLRLYANPKEGKEAIKRLMGSGEHRQGDRE